MNDSIEIIFSTYGCGTRSIWTFIGAIIFLVIAAIAVFVSSSSKTKEGTVSAFPSRVDQLTIYSITALVALAIAVPALAMALGQANTSLITRGNQIHVQGCVLARPFQAVFNRDKMSTTLHYRRSRRSKHVFAALVLREPGQRTVRVGLGDDLIGKKLLKIAPDVMKAYAKQLSHDGESVPAYLAQYIQ